jgi:hypothetical protein
MKSIMIASILFSSGVWAADEVADRAAIENTIRVFSLMPGRAGLFTSDFDPVELAQFGKPPMMAEDAPIPITIEGVPGTVVISKEPMGEAQWFPPGMSAPPLRILTVKKIRFLTEDIAMVDAVGKVPVLIVMRKVLMEWKIASIRRLAAE